MVFKVFLLLVSGGINIVLSSIIFYSHDIKNKANRHFFLFSLFLGIWSLVSFFLFYYGLDLFFRIAMFFFFSSFLLLQLFVRSITHRSRNLFCCALFVLITLSMIPFVFGMKPFLHQYSLAPLHVNIIPGPLFFPVTLFLIFVLVYNLYVMKEGIDVEENEEKRAAMRLILIGLLLHSILLSFNMLLHAFGIRPPWMPPYAVFSFLPSLFLYVALQKYDVFNISPESILSYIFSSIDEGVLIVDNYGKILRLNKRAEEIFDVKGDKVIGMHVKKVFGDNKWGKYFDIETNESIYTHEVKIDDRWYEMENISICSKNIKTGKAFFIKDITEKRKAMESLRIAKDYAEQVSEAKTNFLANMAHEIRTPLNGILGISELLSQTKLDENQREYLNILNASSHLLRDLVNDILDIEKIEAGKLELEEEEFDLKELIYNTVDATYIRAVKKNLEFVVYINPDVPRYVIGDSTKIKQILVNLFGNAVKFTERGGIALKLSKEEEKDGRVMLRFVVKDTGIGIPKEKIPTLFDKYVQADASTTRKFGGTGLGLAIAKELVSIMGGNIHVKSEVGRGTSFIFTIDVGIPERDVEPIGSEYETPLSIFSSIIVSKGNLIRNYLKEVMSLWDIETRAIDDLEEIEFIDLNQYNLLLIDIKEHLSTDFLGKIKTIKEKNKDIKVVTLVPIHLLDEVSKNPYIDKYLLKPINQSKLYNKLLELTGVSKVKEEEEKEERPVYKNGRVYKILITDDNPVNQLIIKEFLIKSPWYVSIDMANNGLEAVKKVKNNHYDLIFMDAQMPELDGIGATKRIREMEKELGIRTPIIALTAAAFKSDKDRFLSSGMDDYVPKPVNRDALYRVLEKFLYKPKREPETQMKKEEKEVQKVMDIADVREDIGDDEMLKELLQMSLTQLSEGIDLLEDAGYKGDIEAVAKISHKLKGGVSAFSKVLYELLKEIEDAARANRPQDEIVSRFDNLREKIGIFKEEVEGFLAKI